MVGTARPTLRAKETDWGGYDLRLSIPEGVLGKGDPAVELEFVAGDWSSVVARKNTLELEYCVRIRLITYKER